MMTQFSLPLLLVSFLCAGAFGAPGPALLSPEVRREIQSYKDVVEKIVNFTVYGAGQNQTYNRLATFVDKFGSRIAGSDNLENAIDYMLDTLKAAGLENVHGEQVMVSHWVRGHEEASLVLPRAKNLAMLGLGSSVGTPPGGLTADAIVVESFDELQDRAAEAKGKIVVYNQGFVSYGVSVAYRVQGAARAAKVGAVASLIRSVTPFSINSPHTGMQVYEGNVTKIPTACITVEDAEMLHRMHKRGENLRIHLYMQAQNLPDKPSRNTVAEIQGAEKPDEVVLASGHLDSWDVGQGAMDDGGGAFISWQALSIVQQLGLRPRRTMRAVLWTSEEQGGVGSQQYYQRHKGEADKMNMVMESDIGTFIPTGIYFAGNEAATAVMQEVVQLLSGLNASSVTPSQDIGTDVALWIQAGVPGAGIVNENDKYFYFHHSEGDTMAVEDPHTLDLCAAVWTAVAYVIADMQSPLPRENVTTHPQPAGNTI